MRFLPDIRMIGRQVTESARHTALAEEGTQTPSLPRSPSRLRRAPQPFCQLLLQDLPTRLWIAEAVLSIGWGALASFHRQGLLTPLPRLPAKGADQLLLLPTFQPTGPEVTKFSDSRFSGSAFCLSSFLTFVSQRTLQLRSAPPVNPACAALPGA